MIDSKLIAEACGLIQRLQEAMLYCSGRRRARISRIHARASARWVRRYTNSHL